MGSKRKDHNEKEHMSRQYRVWRDYLVLCVNEIMPLEESYILLHTANLVGLFTCVFVKQKERQNVRNTCSAEVKRGIRGLHGNKVNGWCTSIIHSPFSNALLPRVP
jgi:hypothetical protein